VTSSWCSSFWTAAHWGGWLSMRATLTGENTCCAFGCCASAVCSGVRRLAENTHQRCYVKHESSKLMLCMHTLHGV
jgi:hypothetical protein